MRSWMAGVWTLGIMLTPAAASAQTATSDVSTASPPGASLEADRAWAAARARDAATIVSIVAGAQIDQTPAAHVPDSLAALPGVLIERVLGAARTVRVRGLEPRLSSVQLNGDRLPSVDAQTRATPLDILPADFFEQIQVSRTFTADMDGDAIGGVVNLVPRQPAAQPRGSFALTGGYHGLRGDAANGGIDGMIGRRLANGRVGIAAGGSFLREGLSTTGFDASYAATSYIDSLNVRSEIIDRTRGGGEGVVDVNLSDRTRLTLTGVAGQLRDHDYERETGFWLYSYSLTRALADQPMVQTLWNGAARVQHELRGQATVDARIAIGQGRQHQDGWLDTLYLLPNPIIQTNFIGRTFDPDNLQLTVLNDDVTAYIPGGQTLAEEVTRDTTIISAANMTLPLAGAATGARTIKFGLKAVRVSKTEERHLGDRGGFYFGSFASAIDPDFDPGPILNGRYTLGPTIDPVQARQAGTPLSPDSQTQAEVNDYTGHETTVVGYAMADLALGSRVSLQPGVRYEWDRRHYDAFSVLREDEPIYDVAPVAATTTRGEWLPMIAARIAASARTTIRAGVTRTIARPNFSDLAPFALGSFQSYALRGNPALRNTSSWNIDVMLDQEVPRGSGRLFAGLFHKRITDPVYLTPAFPSPGAISSPLQPQNGDRATLTGLELGYAQQLRFLPGVWSGLGVTASYTLSASSAIVPARSGDGSAAIYPDRPGHDVTLPGLPRHLGQVAASYDRAGLSARMMLTMQSAAMTQVGSLAWFDQFSAARTQLDCSVSRRLTSHLRAFVDLFNLTNASTRFYLDTPSQPMREEAYGRWATFGARMQF